LVAVVVTVLVSGGDGTYVVQVQVPSSPAGRHTLLAMGSSQIAHAVQLAANQPSQWHASQAGSDVVVIAHPSLADAITPLTDLRRQQGHTVSVVLTDDIYDEFSFGSKTPQAIKDFLVRATARWSRPPRFVLLVGNATQDPRDYFGFGEPDYVPTKVVQTGSIESASDDWFVDFDDDSLPERVTRTQDPDAPTQARPTARHHARAFGLGPPARTDPHAVSRAAVLRRGATPRQRVGRSAGPPRQVGSLDGARSLGRQRGHHL
jgi:hypothetical protein